MITHHSYFLIFIIYRNSLKRRKQGSYSIDASRSAIYAKRTKAFPNNTELEATVTYKGSKAGAYLRSVTPDASAVTVNLHHSLLNYRMMVTKLEHFILIAVSGKIPMLTMPALLMNR